MRVLVAEDDDRLRDVLRRGLEQAGYVVDAVSDGDAADDHLRTYEYELAVLDWRLPGRTGVEVLSGLRRAGNKIPVLMLTARDRPADRVLGLDSGADDYLVKPFDFDELLARLRALQRRPATVQPPLLSVGDIEFDPATMQVRVTGRVCSLTPTELSILEILLRRSPSVVARGAIALHAWAEEADALGSNTIEVHVARLRSKLAGSKCHIETVRSIGYRLVAG